MSLFRLCPMNQARYIIDFQTMPRGFGVVLDRLPDFVCVICRLVGVSRKRRGAFFPISFRLLIPSCRFYCGLEASWTPFGGILEALGKRFGSILGRLHGVFSSLQGDTTVSAHFQ